MGVKPHDIMKKIILALSFIFLFTAANDLDAKPRTIKGKLYYSTNKCLILKTVTGKKYNLKNFGSLEADQRVKLQVETLPKGEIACDGPGTPVSVVKVVKTYPKMTGQQAKTGKTN
jgi:hypothetical protein